MGFKFTGGTAGSLTELVDQMTDEMERKTGVPRSRWDVREKESAPDFTSFRDCRTQAALLGVIEEQGCATRPSIQARLAHLPQLAARLPRFLDYARHRGWMRVIEHNAEGKVFEITPGGRAHIEVNGPVDLPPGSTEIKAE
jgi:hypothetical protein